MSAFQLTAEEKNEIYATLREEILPCTWRKIEEIVNRRWPKGPPELGEPTPSPGDLRDHFASQAMVSFLDQVNPGGAPGVFQFHARASYQMADAMLEARAGKAKGGELK